ncbi:MAG: PIN domain-containing protein [Kineosporiaceae bacterium]
MIGLDTNVLIRHVLQDDEQQSAIASAFLETLGPDDPGFVSLPVVVEVFWVLRGVGSYRTDQITSVISTLLSTAEVRVERADLVARALRATDRGADFADALIAEIGRAAGCRATVTFDRGAARRAGMSLLPGIPG